MPETRHAVLLYPVLDWNLAAVYQLSPPLDDGTEHVIVTAIAAPHSSATVLASNPRGTIASFKPLAGVQGTTSHVAALAALGYEHVVGVEAA